MAELAMTLEEQEQMAQALQKVREAIITTVEAIQELVIQVSEFVARLINGVRTLNNDDKVLTFLSRKCLISGSKGMSKIYSWLHMVRFKCLIARRG